MRTAADFPAEWLGRVADCVDFNPLAVLRLKNAHGAQRSRLVQTHLLPADRQVSLNLLVDDLFYALPLCVGQLVGVGEVKPEPVGGNVRAPLEDVVAQHRAQRREQQMGGGVEPGCRLGVVSQAALEPAGRGGT